MSDHFKPDTLTDEEYKKIKQFDNGLNDFAILNAGDTKEWYFNPRVMEKITDPWKRERVKFSVYDANEDAEKIWNAPISLARRITTFMSQGKYFLRVSRVGSGMTDTKYNVEEIKS